MRLHALKLAGDLAVAYPGRNVSEEHAQAWAAVLETIPEEQAEQAVTNLRRRSIDPPSVAQMVSAIAEVRGLTMSPRIEQPELKDALEPREVLELLRRRTAIPDCPDCGIPHVTRTHDEYIARCDASRELYNVGRKRR